jgi:NAD(P)-dependent dehydrogenase (short-subunit alcohol dehydrogenase family)
MSEPRAVVVTGASAGLGRAIACAFGARGDKVALLARGIDGLESAAKDVVAAGGRALIVQTDVSRWDEVDAAAQKVEAEFGPIDVWVNNAMTSVFAPFNDVTPEEFERVTAVNYLGFVYGTMAAVNRRRRTAARILGLRHLLQARVADEHDKDRPAVVGSIDAVHATTVFGFAAYSRQLLFPGTASG